MLTKKENIEIDLLSEETTRIDQLKGKRLLSEIPFNENDIEQLRCVLLPKGILAWSFPTLTAMMTVGVGIYYYKQGDLWSEFPGIDSPANQSEWGKKFEEFLKYHNSLEKFQAILDEGGHRYVGPILAHGGIPQTCLSDFFGLVTRCGDREQSGQELREILLDSQQKFSQSDRPVKRFLKYGGEVAEEFLSRFLALWQCYERGDMTAKCGLPDRVVEKFSTWWPEHRPKSKISGKRLPKPELRIEPSGLGVYLYLPRCDDHPEIGAKSCWHVLSKDRAVTREHEIPVTPEKEWIVTGIGPNYTVEGIAEKVSVLFFDPYTGKAITEPWLRRLPTKVWALFREDLKADPLPCVIDEFPFWPDYSLAVFDLGEKHQLRIGDNIFEVRRQFFKCDNDPIVQGVNGSEGTQVFSALPRIEWEGKANLSLTKDKEPQGNIDIEADGLTVLLDKAGDYLIELRGPLGETMRKHFVFVPGLKVQPNPPVMWPNNKTVQWHLSANAGKIQSGDTLPPFTSYDSCLEFKVIYGDYEIDLHAQVPKLLWRLLPSLGSQMSEWSGEPMMLWLDDLKENNYPLLECTFGPLVQDAEVLLVGMHLGNQFEAKRQKASKQNSWYFDLRMVRDMLEQSGKAEDFDLLIRSRNGLKQFRGRILSVRPHWYLPDFSAQWKKKNDMHLIDVSWREIGKPIPGRWIVVIPIWRPGQGAILEHKFGDSDYGGSKSWKLPLSELSPGRYMIKAVNAPWGCDDWIGAQAVSEKPIDVYKESWTDKFSGHGAKITVDFYLESLLAHWYRPQLVLTPPQAPKGLTTNEILHFLEGLKLADKLEHINIPRDDIGSLNIFCENSVITTEAYSRLTEPERVDIWVRVLPSPEIITLEVNENDKWFIREVAFQYSQIKADYRAIRFIKLQHGQRELTGILAKWRKNLSKKPPPVDEVIFLCEKFRIFENQGSAYRNEYEQLKANYQVREAI